MPSDFQVGAVTRAPDVARTQRAQETKAESGQQGLRAHLHEESEKSAKEVRPSPKANNPRIDPRQEGRKGRGGSAGERQKHAKDAGNERGRIIDVLG